MVCNFKKVDSQLLQQPNVVPNPEVDIFAKLVGCKYFTAIDLTTAFYSVRVEEGSRKYTAVILRDGRRFEFNTMPMGFGNGPVHLNTALTSEFLDMPWVSIYLDDLIIASKTEEEHADHIKRVFQRLDDLNLS
eukprot:Nk52_evm1s930 gene=Nk52_evmTU1s930